VGEKADLLISYIVDVWLAVMWAMPARVARFHELTKEKKRVMDEHAEKQKKEHDEHT
jgi:hypothetical protein